MQPMLSNTESILWQKYGLNLFFSLLFSSLIAIISIILIFYGRYFRCCLKRLIFTQLRKYLLNRNTRPSDKDAFMSYYRNSLCDFQKVNNNLLRKILKDNGSCAFFTDQSISLSSLDKNSLSNSNEEYLFIEEFRQKFPLTTYENYRGYVDRMVNEGEKGLLCQDKIVFFAASSGTTGKAKLLPVTLPMLKRTIMLVSVAYASIWRSLPVSSYPAPHQKQFSLQTGKRSRQFRRSKDGIPIGPLSQLSSAISLFPGIKRLVSSGNTMDYELLEGITDFETTAFVQLVFGLANQDISSYTVPYASGFLHTLKLIESHFEEICLCLSSTDLSFSSLVREHISDANFRKTLNEALGDTILEYGGLSYKLDRVNHIRKECLKKNTPGLLHRLWPNLAFVSTAIGSSFAIYKKEIEFYCGDKLPLMNYSTYGASEAFLGSLASIHTDEYFLLPTSAFYEFIKEEDIHQPHPKTQLISEIEPGHRYELVCTTDSGLFRYRLGDVVTCTRFLNQADNAIPLPFEKEQIPRIPLVSIAYRSGSLLNLTGENTTEQHVMKALQQTVEKWKQQGIYLEICDFTLYPKLDAFPVRYEMFLELLENDSQHSGKGNEQHELLKNRNPLSEIERQLCEVNQAYRDNRNCGKLGPLICILVHRGTFTDFLNKILVTERVSAVQVKPHRLLKTEEHIKFFNDNQLDSSAFS